jgi:lysophospholipase L1-like esterase
MFQRKYLLKRCSVILLIVFLSACGGADSPQLNALSDDAVILAFGDSLTYGTGANHQTESYPAVLQQLSGKQVINAGIPGEVSQQGLARISDTIQQHQPELVLLCHGGNDMLRKLDVNQLKQNLTAMIEMIRQSGAQVVMLSVPQPGLFLSAAPVYAEVATANQVLLENEIIPDIESEKALKSDPIHPNAAGYRILAEAIHRLLSESGALPQY